MTAKCQAVVFPGFKSGVSVQQGIGTQQGVYKHTNTKHYDYYYYYYLRSYVLLWLLTAFLLRLPAVQGPALGAFSTLLTFEFPIVRARRTIQFQSRNDSEGLGVKG